MTTGRINQVAAFRMPRPGRNGPEAAPHPDPAPTRRGLSPAVVIKALYYKTGRRP